MKKERVKAAVKELGYALLQVLFSRVELFGFIAPVGLPFAFVRVLSGGNIFVCIISFFVSKI